MASRVTKLPAYSRLSTLGGAGIPAFSSERRTRYVRVLSRVYPFFGLGGTATSTPIKEVCPLIVFDEGFYREQVLVNAFDQRPLTLFN